MEILHLIGICPDSLSHIDLLDLICNLYNGQAVDMIKIIFRK